jgi:hypothetical protein
MVARITFPKSVSNALNYNVQKEQQGKAICIGGNGSIVHPAMLNFYQKLALIENRNSLNDRATTKTLHVSLNFSPGETFPTEKLTAIADDYMSQLGFAEQPYLVFKHEDAGHPHIHILASCIKSDGKRINTHNIGRNQSEYARRFVEKKYELIRAENQKVENSKGILPFRYEKLEYGASETRRGIAAIVHGVMGTFNFTSLPEYNAILKQFNILADRGTEESFTWRKNGLVYRVLDTQGEKVGVPIKASALPGFPGLKNLSVQYEKNRKNREPFRQKIRDSLDKALQDKPRDIGSLSAILEQQKIKVVLRQNDTGKIYGITFVDLANRSVFNGSEIGREYSVSGLEKLMRNKPVSGRKRRKKKWIPTNKIQENKGLVEFNGFSMVAEIIKPLEEANIAPYHFTKKKKKIKRR